VLIPSETAQFSTVTASWAAGERFIA
jgi:hypothetical protein